jgi:hypothetical protein
MEYPTYIEVRKVTDKLKKRGAPQIDDFTTEVIQKPGPALWNRIYRSIKKVWEKEKMPTALRAHLIFPIHKQGSKDSIISQQMHYSDSLLIIFYSSYIFRRMYVIIREPSFVCPAGLH